MSERWGKWYENQKLNRKVPSVPLLNEKTKPLEETWGARERSFVEWKRRGKSEERACGVGIRMGADEKRNGHFLGWHQNMEETDSASWNADCKAEPGAESTESAGRKSKGREALLARLHRKIPRGESALGTQSFHPLSPQDETLWVPRCSSYICNQKEDVIKHTCCSYMSCI